ncbi:Uncharacterized protein ALO42_01114 [Pseudomonas syringae pv. atrofaciens]|uniref:Uncharacterized protein n=1 Tax=Pseudomonas syringae pv. atrofaciens TaxID=192087 RepID=A0AAD0IEG4_PSESX|nr:hypothetical protein [Pseudomonas syringae]AVX26200.1 hypothetical protein DA456_23950 [Pseudomonas syringae pv. atrofaciens]KPW11377.1 Uncharacterized protein ALO42_01114 [Pseudomonas syringae pv. atrofaciens]
MKAHAFIYAKYPALKSKRTLALFWMLIATLAVAATFSGPPPFLTEGFGVDERYFSDNMQLLAVVFLGLSRLAALSKRPQKQLIKRLKREHGIKVKPTWKAGVAAGKYLNAAALLILTYYHTETLEALVWLVQMALPA